MKATNVQFGRPVLQFRATPEFCALVHEHCHLEVVPGSIIQISAPDCVAKEENTTVSQTNGHPVTNEDLMVKLGKMEAAIKQVELNTLAVAQGNFDLRRENDELRRLNKDGYFNFAIRVKGEDFLAFAVIMALGNRKAAADHLKIPHRTFYNRVNQWAGRGKDYQIMCRYMDWRKRSARHLKVDLNPSLQTGDADGQSENPDTIADVLTEIKAANTGKSYPAMLSEILQALEHQNSGNWPNVRDELVEMIKEDVLQ